MIGKAREQIEVCSGVAACVQFGILIRTATNSFIYFWNVSKLNFEKIPDLEGFKPFFDRFELTPSFALDTTGPSLIQK